MTKDQICEVVKTKRATSKKPITTYDVFRDTNIPAAQLKAIEYNERRFTVDTLITLCTYLGLEVIVKSTSKK